ncbi:IS200/IS605 family transposase [Streptosporangium roseum]|uniref:IS200/IS605 family transposase n=1 Tax=Streptosporangium roseum TaxID=2001 RepID=UPI003D9E8720
MQLLTVHGMHGSGRVVGSVTHCPSRLTARGDVAGCVHRGRPRAPARGLPPKLPISTLVNRLKGVSAHYLRKEFTGQIDRHIMHGHLWSPSYFAGSCGAPLEIIREYIENQQRPD